MSDVFDLSKISHLIETQRPSRVLIMDTNITMNYPDYNDWSVEAGGRNLFVLSDTLVQELEYISTKEGTREKTQSRAKAEIAIKSLASLLRQGSVTEGIPVQHGWVIGVPSPRKANLDPELEQLEDIVRAFKRSDTKLLLLTRECHELFKSTPVTLVTGDWNFFNEVQMQGVPCHLCTSFPIEALEEAAAITREVDWDGVLREIASDARERSVAVEVTLTARRLAPSWLVTGTKPFMIAEGQGVMRAGSQIRPFLWTLPYHPLKLRPRSGDSDGGPAELPPIHLDFLGESDFGQDLFDAIADRLSDCTDLIPDERGPTVHSPRSVMEILAYLEYVSSEGPSDNALDDLMDEISNAGGFVDYWANRILAIGNPDERYACLQLLLEALDNCWETGATHTFGIIVGQ